MAISTSPAGTLALSSRTATGTTAAHALRREGKVPGVLFGHGVPLPISLEARALEGVLHDKASSRLLSIVIDGTSQDTALLREVQRDPVSKQIVHADFQRVSASESIHASLRVVTVGVAEGVRLSGGVLDLVLHELEVQGPADALPERLEVDVTALRIHGQVTAAQVQLPAGFKMLTPADTVIITVEGSRTAGDVEAAAPPAAAPAADTKGA